MADELKSERYEVYLIVTEDDKLYTGIAKDADKRFLEHLGSPKGAKFFRRSKPLKIMYREWQPNRSEATKREMAIKKLKRQQKLALINQ